MLITHTPAMLSFGGSIVSLALSRPFASMRACQAFHLKFLKVLLVGVCAAFWFVHMTTLLQQTQVALAPYYHQDQAVMSNNKDLSLSFPNKENKVMAFIRIPKTGSTSLLNVLSRTGFQNYNSLLSASYWHSMSDRRLTIYSCMFVGPSTFNSTRRRVRKNPQCGHANHGELLSAYVESFSDVRSSSNANLLPPLQTFAVVREPFDRLRSYFFYMRKFVNGSQWSRLSFTQEQYQQVINGNFPRWLELLYQHKSPIMQYKYLDRNVTAAIEMMENGTVHVYVNECFEASLRLMAERYGFDVDEILMKDSKVIQANTNKKQYADLFTKEELDKLRESAKVWFSEEYRLYKSCSCKGSFFQRHCYS